MGSSKIFSWRLSGLLLGIILPVSAVPTATGWYDQPPLGWMWYHDPKPQSLPQPDPKPSAPDASSRPSEASYPYSKQAETFRKDLDEAVAKAVLYPTLENITEVQRRQNDILDRALAFEEVWMMASLTLPQNYREASQPAPKHRKIYEEQEERRLDQNIQQLAKTFGLFFFFSSDCPYCHEMAPLVRELADHFKFEVKAISPDGQPLKEFPDAVKDNGSIGQLNPEKIFPCLFMVNPQTRQVIPVARGLVTPSNLRENFKIVVQYLKEHAHEK